ncbi:YdcF family protein [Companilactobacillus sp. DQM5]|uniref:YdcF family protein n=1 Tax=Companilactobacillus sp. DQM5 TaxID=3463359 RepID=UPI0040585F64
MLKIMLILLGIILGSLLGITIVFIIDIMYSFWPRKLKKFKNVIVLGARINDDDSVTETLKNRLDLGIKLLKKDGIIIVSGGKDKGNKVSEALAMKKYLVFKGISEKVIILEEKSKNTLENIINSKKIAKSDDVAIATSNYHVSRVKTEALKNGFHVKVYGAKTRKDILYRLTRIELLAILWKNKKFFFTLLIILILLVIAIIMGV